MASAIVIILPIIRIERCDDEQDNMPRPRVARRPAPADVVSILDARMRREFEALRTAVAAAEVSDHG
jgi:hypothetical protein